MKPKEKLVIKHHENGSFYVHYAPTAEFHKGQPCGFRVDDDTLRTVNDFPTEKEAVAAIANMKKLIVLDGYNKKQEARELKENGKIYYNIRIVRALDYADANERIESGEFDDNDDMCDIIVTRQELEAILANRPGI